MLNKKYYEAIIPLKLGYYNYQFITTDENNKLSSLRIDEVIIRQKTVIKP